MYSVRALVARQHLLKLDKMLLSMHPLVSFWYAQVCACVFHSPRKTYAYLITYFTVYTSYNETPGFCLSHHHLCCGDFYWSAITGVFNWKPNNLIVGLKCNDGKIRGVNAGGWLVLESWMTPSLFDEFHDQYSRMYSKSLLWSKQNIYAVSHSTCQSKCFSK